MLDVGDTQILASLCGHAALQLVEEVRPRARVRLFPGGPLFTASFEIRRAGDATIRLQWLL